MGIPLRDEKSILESAKLFGLHIIEGIPAAISSKEVIYFPVSRFNVYTLGNDPEGISALAMLEKAQKK
jgi:hypothetical protein